MKKYSYFIIVLVLFSCERTSIENIFPKPENEVIMSTTIQVGIEEPSITTRLIDERAVHDLNLYLFQAGSNNYYHYYTSATSIDITVLKGIYTAYCIVNAGRNLGNSTVNDIENLVMDYTVHETHLLMSAKQQIDLTGQFQEPYTIAVRRNYAKIQCNISISSSFSDVSLHSVQLVNIPLSMKVFESSAPYNSPGYVNSDILDIGGSIREFNKTFYIPENLKGKVSSITNQKNRTLSNAPTNATYIHIRALKGNFKVLDYFIFLGENNTNDFNIKRNSIQSINIRLDGENITDARHHNYGITITDGPTYKDIKYSCITNPISCKIQIQTSSDIYKFKCRVEIVNDLNNHFNFDGVSYKKELDINLNSTKSANFSIHISPIAFSTMLSRVVTYKIFVTDEVGQQTIFTKTATAENYFTIVENIGEMGSFIAWGDFDRQTVQTGNILQHTLYVHPGETVYLRAAPNGPGLFSGWHSDGGIYSSEYEISFLSPVWANTPTLTPKYSRF